MKSNTLGILLAATVFAAAGWFTQSAGGEVAPGPKVSQYAPAEDLLAQVELFVERAEDALEEKEKYQMARQKILEKSASTLAVLGLALGMHDQPNKLKKSAAALFAASSRLAKAIRRSNSSSPNSPCRVPFTAWGATNNMPSFG